MRRRLADRRGRPRFEIVGNLWGNLDTAVAMPLRDVSAGGALVHSEVPLTPGSEHHVTITCDGVPVPTKVRVCHVRKLVGDSGRAIYLIGLEFVSVGSVLQSQIELWLLGGTTHAEA